MFRYKTTTWNPGAALLAAIVLVAIPSSVANADFTLGEPANLGPTVNGSGAEGYPSISADGLSLYFWSDRPGGYSGGDIWVTTRASVSDPWGAPVNLGATVNSPVGQTTPNISPDGLSLYFASSRDRGGAAADLYVTTRATLSDAWGPAVNLGPTVNSSAGGQGGPSISADGLSLYFASDRPGGYGMVDLWVTTRATLSDPWGPPANLGRTVNSNAFEAHPSISADGLALFFEGGSGYPDDIWVTRRAAVSDPWGPPVHLGPGVNLSAADDATPNISADGRTLYFCSNRPGGYGGYDMWQVPIIPVVDFNGDGKVDGEEVLAMAQHWGSDQSLYDIGPTPLGDGIVDVNDLTVLAGYIGQDVNDPTLIAHWALDEAAGMTAADGIAGNNATVMGAAWQPAGGKIGGALAFDGKDDFAMSAKPVLDPAKGAFSALAWIKGGAAGQTILSQANGANWLMADAATGALATELSKTRTGSKLSSQAVITDGNWHRIAFTWDGMNRRLYVDSVLVAQDAQDNLAASSGSLFIGTNKAMAPGTFWSGLIDDVRVYNRAVQP